jgi:hypothetical protein
MDGASLAHQDLIDRSAPPHRHWIIILFQCDRSSDGMDYASLIDLAMQDGSDRRAGIFRKLPHIH